MGYEFIRVERQGRLTRVTINRPRALNALHPEAATEMAAAFDDFAADPEQWLAVVTGAGERAFCAGADLKAKARHGTLKWPPSGFGGLTGRFDLWKPVIASVNGVALGGGFELALACDLVIAAETASFALPEPTVGLAALAGGLQRLPRAIGATRALGLILTARQVSASEGHLLGFVNDVVPAAQLEATTAELAERILSLGPLAIRAAKEAVLRGLGEPSLEAAMVAQLCYPSVRTMLRSEDSKEGPRAFVEGRKPGWRGA